jgi:diguanylate cyclase (GGDEF)-like protein/PAS domain S-box-containing protein
MYDERDVFLAAQKMLTLYREGQYQTLLDEYFDPDAIFILPGCHAPLQGIDELNTKLFSSEAASSLSYILAKMRFEVRRASGDIFLFCGFSGPSNANQPFSDDVILNLSCVFKETEPGLKLISFHTSIPFHEQVLHCAATDVFGAAFFCSADEGLHILHMNESFLSLFGYTREELKTCFSGSFLAMVNPLDRAYVLIPPEGVTKDTVQETEFRIICKNGESKWVMQRRQFKTCVNGDPYFCCILVDISASKQQQHALSMRLQRHEIILNQTNDIIFEWDIEINRFSVSANWEKLFGYKMYDTTYEEILQSIRVHPADRDALLLFYNNILRGVPYTEGELRLGRADGTYIWCRGRSTQLFDANGSLIKAIGVISNIDADKQRTQMLLKKAERDALTGLYNKGTVQSLIAEHLKSRRNDRMDALMIIDIDNFKGVNDSEGHPFGDTLLTHIAECLTNTFRSTDLIGRIGGDEFIVFTRDIPDVELIRQKAEQALVAFRTLPAAQKRLLAVSCSIGIAITGTQSITLDELYSNADWALYQAKRGGKNRHALYENDDDPALREAHTSLGKKIRG